MSNNENDVLIERAHEAMEWFEGTILEDVLANAIKEGEMERLAFLVSQAEAEIAREKFFTSDVLGHNDEYMLGYHDEY